MKKIAFYLPQFHTIPENDKWWGEGFTEWSNVKKATSLFKGHHKPEVPYSKNYYNLLNSEAQEEQANLAKKYGIDGFCYYHYWFEGKLLLQKPMENMLENDKVDIPFCICWANESWSRTWDGRESDILIKQNYNENKNEWKKHFEYFLPFFKDSRYIKHNNMPMIIIYKPQLINKCKEMLDLWSKMAVEAGFSGLYIGYQHHSAFDYNMKQLGFDFGIEFEPLYTLNREMNKEKRIESVIKHPVLCSKKMIRKLKNKIGYRDYPVIVDYDEVWKRIIKRKHIDKSIMPGAFPSWDNTPRKGKDGIVFYKSSPKKFKKYFELQVEHLNNEYKPEYIFINAWNEWGEGAHLEPDELNGFGYLEAISHDVE